MQELTTTPKPTRSQRSAYWMAIGICCGLWVASALLLHACFHGAHGVLALLTACAYVGARLASVHCNWPLYDFYGGSPLYLLAMGQAWGLIALNLWGHDWQWTDHSALPVVLAFAGIFFGAFAEIVLATFEWGITLGWDPQKMAAASNLKANSHD